VLQPLPFALPEVVDEGSHESDIEELWIFIKEWAELLYDVNKIAHSRYEFVHSTLLSPGSERRRLKWWPFSSEKVAYRPCQGFSTVSG
jgi:hypothetical protein